MTPNEMLAMIAQLRRERNEAREQNAKLREIADALAVALSDLTCSTAPSKTRKPQCRDRIGYGVRCKCLTPNSTVSRGVRNE